MPLTFHGALINSSSAWASTKEQLTELYRCPHVGAVTIRTSMLDGFKHVDDIHQWTFLDVRTSSPVPERSPNAHSSFNTFGYSPTPLNEYLMMIESIVKESTSEKTKPFIVSVTGTAEEVVECKRKIAEHALRTSIPLLMEINLSCPNIENKSPPAFSGPALQEYLFALQRAQMPSAAIPVGIKIPPYTHYEQFKTVIDALEATTGGGIECSIDFITATNALGNCLVLNNSEEVSGQVPAIGSMSGTGIGGLGGAAIHSLALGNVKTLRRMLDERKSLSHIEIIGTGGVSDYLGYLRMRSVGAATVAIATGFGKAGIDVFYKIASELRSIDRTSRASMTS